MQAAETAAQTIAVALVRLRALVLALGETSKPAWWRTEFMNETGLRFLERLYPRSVLQAALHAAGKSACEIHDQAIGRRGVYHLFRLPGNLENAIRDRLVADGFLGELRPLLGDSGKLVAALIEMGGSVAKLAPGPLKLGAADELSDPSAIRRLAAAYAAAFKSSTTTFPYFEIKRGWEA